ncbi:MAG: SIS domain-containing protein [Acidobacteriia bacterium]|nr:SIS domain-containing protein [Terriglobia bacterium]
MAALSNLLNLPEGDKTARGLLHTPQEIAQQPATWESTFGRFQNRHTVIREFLREAGVSGDPRQRPTVFLLGAGTSDYIGRTLTHLLRRLWQCEVVAVPTTDLLTHFEESLLPQRRYLWISFSRSGDSPESVAVLERALNTHPDIHHLIVSCNAEGRMVRDTAGKDQVLSVCLDDKVNDRGLAMTSSFSNMVVFGQCMAHAENPGEYEKVFRQLVGAGKNFLNTAADCAAELANGGYSKACFVGSGALRGVANESALKLLEMTAGKTLTMSESTLGLRHGPMAALDDETLFVCFLSGDGRTQKYEADLLEEIGRKHLVRTRVVVGCEATPRLAAFSEHLLTPANALTVADEYRAPVDVMFGQALGLFFSLRWGLKPDCPSPNGAITRVVQNVSIYA